MPRVLTKAIRTVKQGEGLILSPRIERFLREHGDVLMTEQQAMDWLVPLVSSGKNSIRHSRFGASSRGTCERRQVFSFLGMPVGGMRDTELQNLFNDGTWRHLRWQMTGMLAGAFTAVEVGYKLPKYSLSVSLDAENKDEGWFFELKGDRNTSRFLDQGVPERHLLQIHTCMLATGYDTCVYVVEDKSNQTYREFIVKEDPAIMAEVVMELERLNTALDSKTLPAVLNVCAQKEGEYRSCPYAADCLGHAEWMEDSWIDEREWLWRDEA